MTRTELQGHISVGILNTHSIHNNYHTPQIFISQIGITVGMVLISDGFKGIHDLTML